MLKASCSFMVSGPNLVVKTDDEEKGEEDQDDQEEAEDEREEEKEEKKEEEHDDDQFKQVQVIHVKVRKDFIKNLSTPFSLNCSLNFYVCDLWT